MERRDNRITEITEKLKSETKALFESDRYRDYLSTMAKFHTYSVNNTVLIASQRPDASLVAGYKAWQQNFNRHVVAGAKGIQIIQPAPWKKTEQVEAKDENGNTILKNGKPIMEEVEHIMQGFKVGYVYAYEDTEGTPLPSVVNICDDQVVNVGQFITALCEVSPVPIVYEHIDSGVNGFYSLVGRNIHVEESLPDMQRIKTTIHEIGHAFLHDRDTGTDAGANKREREVEAESVAYTVCSYYNLDTSDYSFGYIAGWSKDKSLQELQDKLHVIKETAGTIIDRLDAEFMKLQMAETAQLAYRNGQEFFFIHATEGGYQYKVYDTDYRPLRYGTVDDMTLPIDKAAKQGMAQSGFRSDFATLFNDEALVEKVTQAEQATLVRQELAPEPAMAETHHVSMRL